MAAPVMNFSQPTFTTGTGVSLLKRVSQCVVCAAVCCRVFKHLRTGPSVSLF